MLVVPFIIVYVRRPPKKYRCKMCEGRLLVSYLMREGPLIKQEQCCRELCNVLHNVHVISKKLIFRILGVKGPLL